MWMNLYSDSIWCINYSYCCVDLYIIYIYIYMHDSSIINVYNVYIYMHESTESGMLQMTSSGTLLVHSFEQDTVDPTNRYSLMLILFLRCLRHPLFDVWRPERRGYVQDMFCDVFMLQDVRDPCLFSWQLQQSMWMVRDSSWSLFVWFAAQAQSQYVNEAVLGFHLGVPYLSW